MSASLPPHFGPVASAPTTFPPHPFSQRTDRDIAAGTYAAICIDVAVLENVARNKWRSDVIEWVNMVSFLFHVLLPDGTRKAVATKLLTVSLCRLSKLFAFLRDWAGEPPDEDSDPTHCIGRMATLTINRVPSATRPGRLYPQITAIAPPTSSAGTQECKFAEGTPR
jgi:hypothetical protein